MMHIDQSRLRDDWRLREGRREMSGAGTSQGAESSDSHPGNEASPVAADRRVTHVVTRRATMARSSLLGGISNNASPSWSAEGVRRTQASLSLLDSPPEQGR